MILTALLLGYLSRTFSGFRSQWTISTSSLARNCSAFRMCLANFRTRFSDTPRKCVFRSRSYRLKDSISNTRHW